MTADLFVRPRRGERLEAGTEVPCGDWAAGPVGAGQDPYSWVRGLCGTQAAFALALSDMPRTKAARDQALGGYITPHRPDPRVLGEPRRLTDAGMRVANSWVAQGVRCFGGPLALWEAAAQWRRRTMKNQDNNTTDQDNEDLEKRLGGQRRLNNAIDLASYVTDYNPVYVRIRGSEHNSALIRRVHILYSPGWPNPRSAPTAVFKLGRHDAHMVAASFGRTLVPHPAGGYWLD